LKDSDFVFNIGGSIRGAIVGAILGAILGAIGGAIDRNSGALGKAFEFGIGGALIGALLCYGLPPTPRAPRT